MRADRLLAILLHLQARGRMTAGDLARRLEVSERTIYRDIEALSAAGVPVYAERGANGGCVLAEGYRTNLTGLREAEVRTLFMAGTPSLLRDLGLGKTLEDALLKLLATLPTAQRLHAERARQRIYVDPAGWWRPEEAVPHLVTLHQALWDDLTLRMTYRKSGGEVVERTVHPLGLVAKASVWYLVATSEGNLRVYRVSRVLEMAVLEERCVRPDGFDLAAYWQTWSAEFQATWRRYAVRLRCAPTLLEMWRRHYGAEFEQVVRQIEPADASGWVSATLHFDSEEAARGSLLGYADTVEVLEPPTLRTQIAEHAARTAAFYAARLAATAP